MKFGTLARQKLAEWPPLRNTMMQSGAALILGLSILWVPLPVEAQQTGKVWRIGVLMPAERPGALEALVEGLREFSYVESRNLILEHRRFTRNDQLPTLATSLSGSIPTSSSQGPEGPPLP